MTTVMGRPRSPLDTWMRFPDLFPILTTEVIGDLILTTGDYSNTYPNDQWDWYIHLYLISFILMVKCEFTGLCISHTLILWDT